MVRENCHLLTSGAITPNPSELLASRRMWALLSEWEAVYDYILVDVPAVMAVTDPVVVGTVCQGVLLVVRAHKTSPLAIRRALAQLDMAHIPTVGVVVNGLKLALGYGYYSNRDNYHYYNNHSESGQRHSKRRQKSQTESLEQVLAHLRRKT